MKCPECKRESNQIIDTRDRKDYVYRRRECLCGYRFATYEMIVRGIGYHEKTDAHSNSVFTNGKRDR